MADDMKSAFEKAGYKAQEKQPNQTPNSFRSNAQEPTRTGAQNYASTNAVPKFVLKENYASQAEGVIKSLRNDRNMDYQNFTTSKIRNILAMVSEIYNDIQAERNDILNMELQSRIEYLKVKLVYECGRERKTVKPFVEKAGLLDLLDGIGDSKKKFIDFARYMEALVAYHRFYNGKEI